MREIRKKDDKIFNLLLERAKMIEEGRRITEEIEELDKKRKKLALQADKVRDKIISFVNKIRKSEFSKYENTESVVADKEAGEIVIKVFDAIEEYKKVLDKKIEEGKF